MRNWSFRTTFLAGFVIVSSFSPPAAGQTASDVVCEGCVDATDIRDGAVTRKKIRAKAVNPAKLSPDAKPAGVGGLFFELLVPSDGSMVDPGSYINLVPPAATGYAILQAAYDVTSEPSDTLITCFVRRDGTTVPEASRALTTAIRTVPGSIVWSEAVGAGPIAYSIACSKEAGGFTSTVSGTLVVTWVPQSYDEGYISVVGGRSGARADVQAHQVRE